MSRSLRLTVSLNAVTPIVAMPAFHMYFNAVEGSSLTERVLLRRAYLLAADQGHASAQYQLGVLYELCHGVPQDDKHAVQWYRLAADQGHAGAQYNLGIMYSIGLGVPRSLTQAYAWWAHAAANGDEKARLNMEIAIKKMTPAEVEKIRELDKIYTARTSKRPDQPSAQGL